MKYIFHIIPKNRIFFTAFLIYIQLYMYTQKHNEVLFQSTLLRKVVRRWLLSFSVWIFLRCAPTQDRFSSKRNKVKNYFEQKWPTWPLHTFFQPCVIIALFRPVQNGCEQAWDSATRVCITLPVVGFLNTGQVLPQIFRCFLLVEVTVDDRLLSHPGTGCLGWNKGRCNGEGEFWVMECCVDLGFHRVPEC